MSLFDRVRDGNGWFTHTWPLANSLNTLKIAQDIILIIILTFPFELLAPEEIKDFHVAIVVLRHLLAFAFANATRDFTPASAI